MKPNNENSCDVNVLNHKSSTLIICFVGAMAILGMLFCGLALSIVLWRNDQRELAVITALISTIGNAISLCIGVLIPSPVQPNRSRSSDAPDATGKKEDPVHTVEESGELPPDAPQGEETNASQ